MKKMVTARHLFRVILILFMFQWFCSPTPLVAQDLLDEARRIVFLGDSITYSGEYVSMLEAAIRLEFPEKDFEFIDLGLPSETVSGFSEPGHANGSFPRPDLHERLDRLLEKTMPDMVIACYGMNCGIYHPYSDERFDGYRAGIRRLRDKVLSRNAKLVLLTPPVFDPLPIWNQTLPAGETVYQQPYRGYNEVLDLYAAWIAAAQYGSWRAIDTHTPMNQFLAARRVTAPDFTIAPDGVHLNSQGHWLIARELIRQLGPSRVNTSADNFEEGFSAIGDMSPLLEKIKSRQRLLTDAWLSEVGHRRPGMNKGLPLPEAIEQAKILDREIREFTTKSN